MATITELLLAELDREMVGTRRTLERVIDIDQPGHAIDAGWEAAVARIAARTANLT